MARPKCIKLAMMENHSFNSSRGALRRALAGGCSADFAVQRAAIAARQPPVPKLPIADGIGAPTMSALQLPKLGRRAAIGRPG